MKKYLNLRKKKPDGKHVRKMVYLTFDDGSSNLTGQFSPEMKETVSTIHPDVECIHE
ncbi:hypothetical protein [Bacillus cereus]|uniref:hypothetical protein n=1 Tax=Bacillus cereus TaxID=1396 RepID=UPI00039F14A4|nr:hypothetical protein [Bacillus cereus]